MHSSYYTPFIFHKAVNLISGRRTNDYIKFLLNRDAPCMIGRLGSVEVGAMLKIERMKETNTMERIYEANNLPQVDQSLSLVKKSELWNIKHWRYMRDNAGFFPINKIMLNKYFSYMVQSIGNVDLIGSFTKPESRYHYLLKKDTMVSPLKDLEPFSNEEPWTSALENKKILVIHPFAESIKNQYEKNRDKIFNGVNILPDFELKCIKAVQSHGGQNGYHNFNNWFEAFDWMLESALKIDFDIALIGCGAYGFPLASRIKQYGKKAIHLGGVTQILFGIKGKRWDSRGYISKFYNEYWVRPNNSETPDLAKEIEDSCYW